MNTATTTRKFSTAFRIAFEMVCIVCFMAILSADWEHILTKLGF